jgi:hypothetical protein
MKLKDLVFKFIIAFTFITSIFSCGSIKQIPITNNKETIYRDSLILRDSTRYIDSIIYVSIPREKVMDIISQIDTSYLETSVAQSVAYIDTMSLMIVHSLENKDTVLKEKIVYKDRYITKTNTIYRDSITVQEIPVEVEVVKTAYPKTYWWLLGFFVIVVGIFIVKIYFKLKK